MINVLFISIAFPPKKDSECIQTAKYFKYLSNEKKFNINVITSKSPTLHMPEDDSLKKYVCGYTQKIEIPIWENKYVNIINEKFGNPLRFLPDTRYLFHKKIERYFNKVKNKPDFIYSRSYPISSAIAAYKAKKYYNVPWLMHLSDPWYLSPLHNYEGRIDAYHKNEEKKLLNTADFISFTSTETVELYKNEYPEFTDKFLYYPNVYDQEDFKQRKIQFKDKLKIVYTGGLVGNRGVNPIIDALKLVDKEIKNNLEFIFIGEADRTNRNLFNECNEKCVIYKGSVSFEIAKRIQSESNILLLIDNYFENASEAIYFPSKLLDYIIAERKILAITTPNGTTDQIVKRLNAVSFGHNDSHGIARFLVEAVLKFKLKESNYFENSMVPEEFDAEYNVNRLIQLIQKNA